MQSKMWKQHLQRLGKWYYESTLSASVNSTNTFIFRFKSLATSPTAPIFYPHSTVGWYQSLGYLVSAIATCKIFITYHIIFTPYIDVCILYLMHMCLKPFHIERMPKIFMTLNEFINIYAHFIIFMQKMTTVVILWTSKIPPAVMDIHSLTTDITT